MKNKEKDLRDESLVTLNGSYFDHKYERTCSDEFLNKLKSLMLEYKVTRIDLSINAFSLLEAHLQKNES